MKRVGQTRRRKWQRISFEAACEEEESWKAAISVWRAMWTDYALFMRGMRQLTPQASPVSGPKPIGYTGHEYTSDEATRCVSASFLRYANFGSKFRRAWRLWTGLPGRLRGADERLDKTCQTRLENVGCALYGHLPGTVR